MNRAAGPVPRVTIGMPVYNGARHVTQAIDSLLSQTFGDFELIIADNASTDRTGEICRDYQARDPRVHYVRHATNRGAVFNWNFVVAEARGQYFKWASANDYCAPTQLERCVQVLDTEPEVIITYGRTAFVDDEGQPLGEYPHDVEVLDARPSVRFERLCRELRANNAQSGLIRLATLRRTGIERAYPGGDMNLMAELALYGGFRRIPEVLLFRRMGVESATRFRSASELRTFLNPVAKKRADFVMWQTHWDYLASMRRAPLRLRERLAVLKYILRSAWWFRSQLWREVAAVFTQSGNADIGRRPLRIGLFGLFGVRNLGNEATLAATVSALRERAPDAELVLVSSLPAARAGLPQITRQIEPDQLPLLDRSWPCMPYRWKKPVAAFMQRATEPLRRLRTRRVARQIDMLLIAGTGIADDFGQGHLEAPHHLARWCEVVRGQGGTVCFASIGAGPAAHPLARRWFGDALRAANYRSYREHSSRRFAQEIGVDVSLDQVMPDLVFGLPLAGSTAVREPDWPPKSIGLGVMGYSGWNLEGLAAKKTYAAYLAKTEWLARQLLDSGYRVHLLIGNRGGDRKPVADLCKALAGQLAAGTLVASELLTHDDLLSEIAATDLVIATRFHNVLKSLRMGRPVISIGYATKNDELMREMGLEQYCHNVDKFEPAQVVEQVRSLAAMPRPPVAKLRERVTEYGQALATQFDRILQLTRASED